VYLGGCTSRTCHFDGLEAVVFTRLYDKLNLLSFPQTPETFRFDCGLQLADNAVVSPAKPLTGQIAIGVVHSLRGSVPF